MATPKHPPSAHSTQPIEVPETIRRAVPVSAQPTPSKTTWEKVPVLAYKEDAMTPFKAVTRQVLFSSPDLKGELRYFDVAAGGHSTLERHAHVHGVMIFRGVGRCLVGDKVTTVGTGDLVYIAPMTWHQFRADQGEALGFLCLVDATRDKPQLPTPEELAAMKQVAEVARFLES